MDEDKEAAVKSRRSADSLGWFERSSIYLVLLGSSFAYNYNFVLIDFIRPYLVRHAGMTLPETAWLYTGQGSGVILGSFLVPILISRFGCKRVLVLATLALGLLTGLNEFPTGFVAWVSLRFLVGLALTGTYTSSITLLANFVPPRLRGRLLAINMAMFSVALLAVGSLGRAVGEEGWWFLVRFGWIVPLLLVGFTLLGLPDERRFLVYADRDVADEAHVSRGRWSEMLKPPRLWLMLTCLLLAGLNFSGYQFYSGFITTYLLTVRHFDPSLTGLFVVIDGAGTLLGSLLWGTLADRLGRRVNAIGFVLVALFIVIFLVAPVATPVLMAVEFGYAVCLSCTNVWAAYFAELFPVRLRPMGTSLFHGGHIVSLAAPLIVTLVAAHATLPIGMALAPVTFLIGALLWSRLPETLRTSPFYRGFSADAPTPPDGRQPIRTSDTRSR